MDEVKLLPCAVCGIHPSEPNSQFCSQYCRNIAIQRQNTRPTLVTDEVVERVARVLTRELGIDPDFTAPAAPEMKMWQLRTDLARAAIAAMPTIPPQGLDDHALPPSGLSRDASQAKPAAAIARK